MTTATKNVYRNDNFAKNAARVYNADSSRKTLGQKLRAYWDETVKFYSDLYEKNGYRPLRFFGM